MNPRTNTSDSTARTAAKIDYQKKLRLEAVRAARRVEHLLTDPLSVAAIQVAEAYAKGSATANQLKAAQAVAQAAAWAAQAAANAAAWNATKAADTAVLAAAHARRAD